MKRDPSLMWKLSSTRAVVSLVLAMVIAGGEAAAQTPAPPTSAQPTSAQPTVQQATPAIIAVDPLLGITVVQAALLGVLVGALAAGGITYVVQSRLDKNRRAEVEQRLAFAQLIQVTAFAAGTRTALDKITPYGEMAFPPMAGQLQDEVNKGEMPRPVAWCAVIASSLDNRKARNSLRPMIGLLNDSTASFSESLTALQIRGKDFADMAPQAIAAHSAVVKEIASCITSFKSLVAAFADNAVPSDILGRLALGTWQSMNRVATTLEALRKSLIPPSKVTAAAAAQMYADLETLATTGTDTGISSNMAFDRAMALLREAHGPTG